METFQPDLSLPRAQFPFFACWRPSFCFSSVPFGINSGGNFRASLPPPPQNKICLLEQAKVQKDVQVVQRKGFKSKPSFWTRENAFIFYFFLLFNQFPPFIASSAGPSLSLLTGCGAVNEGEKKRPRPFWQADGSPRRPEPSPSSSEKMALI